ncbi:leucine-rich_repeat domain-containing protein [Hexamita inflata]|uniref:Leucine-rich repeat domain-containing protein n=1 Tax=Hexamita inflata TaxID=28002 RepID=A0AA86UEZ6_9EUKA|nr:leucine-rich repeat domain-containing protein [Hexamita inflata]
MMTQLQYDNEMINIFKSEVRAQELSIQNYETLQSFKFCESLPISTLMLQSCENIRFGRVPSNITKLIINQCNLLNIYGIQHMNLKYLDLNVNLIHDTDCLGQILSLNELSLQANCISDISPLSTLTNLQSLSLLGNKVNNIQPLSFLINLERLNLSRNEVEDLSPLRSLVSLIDVNLSFNKIWNIDPLQKLNVQKLVLSNNKIVDINSLSENLREVYLRSNQIVHVKPLASMTQIQYLDIAVNPIVDDQSLDEHQYRQNFYVDYIFTPSTKQVFRIKLYATNSRQVKVADEHKKPTSQNS